MWRFNHTRFHPAARLLISAVILFTLLCTTPASLTRADDDGYALAFDGVNANVKLAETSYIMAPTWVDTMTVEMWVKPEGPPVTCPNGNVAACDFILADRPEWWGITRGILGGQDRIWFYNWDGNMDQIGIPYTPGEWVHIAWVHNGGVLRAYKNGVLAASVSSGTTLQPSTGALPVIYLGGVIFNASRIYTFQGQIDEVRLWNVARSSAEINATMRSLLSGSETGLAAYYQMSDGAGLVLTDDSVDIYDWNGTLLDWGPGVPPNGFPPQWVTSTAFDVIAPTVTINQAPGQADPTNTSPITFEVVFSEPVTGFETGDVTLEGTAGATIGTVTGSGATYTVAVSGMTGSGTVIASIPAGVAQNAAAVGNSLSTSSDNSVTYDVIPPTVLINKADSQADPTNTSPINFTVVFSEAVNDFGEIDVTVEGTAGATTAAVTGSGTTYNVAVSGMTGSGTVIASIAAGVAHDAAGNPNTAGTGVDNSVLYDVTAPSVTVNPADGQADPTNLSPVNFSIVFSEVVTGFDGLDVILAGTAGATTATVTGSGATYNVAVSGMTGSGTVIASIPAGTAHDAVGNPNEAGPQSSVAYDITGPTVTLSQAEGQANPTYTSPVNFTVVFSEAVTDFGSQDVSLGGTAGAITATVTGSGTTYNVAVSSMAGAGTVTASIAAGAVHDALGNPNSASAEGAVIFVYQNWIYLPLITR
jgi:hypothetical protein